MDEGFYSGSTLNARDEKAYKNAQYELREYVYDSSNGVSSDGDIIKTGP